MAAKKKGKKVGATNPVAGVAPTMASLFAKKATKKAAAGTLHEFSFTLKGDSVAVLVVAHVDSESNKLVFSADTATARVNAGPHALVWTATGAKGSGFSFKLSGDVDREQAGGGNIPPAGVTAGVINFVAGGAAT